jgi:hypothetical protein
MTIKKDDRFRANYSNQVYQVAGKWGQDIVLAPVNPDDEECLIYEASEIEELLDAGKFVKEEEGAK